METTNSLRVLALKEKWKNKTIKFVTLAKWAELFLHVHKANTLKEGVRKRVFDAMKEALHYHGVDVKSNASELLIIEKFRSMLSQNPQKEYDLVRCVFVIDGCHDALLQQFPDSNNVIEDILAILDSEIPK